MIKVTEGMDGKLALEFPFELKDSFKKAFRSAEWNAASKKWTIAASAKKRVDDWIDGVTKSGVLEDLADRSAEEMNERELERLTIEMNTIKRELASVLKNAEISEARMVKRQSLIAEIEKTRGEIVAAKDQEAQAKAAADEAKQRLVDEIGSLVDRDAMQEQIRIIRKNAGVAKSYASSAVETAQYALLDLHKPVRLAGFRFPAVRDLINKNKYKVTRDECDAAARAVDEMLIVKVVE